MLVRVVRGWNPLLLYPVPSFRYALKPRSPFSIVLMNDCAATNNTAADRSTFVKAHAMVAESCVMTSSKVLLRGPRQHHKQRRKEPSQKPRQ